MADHPDFNMPFLPGKNVEYDYKMLLVYMVMKITKIGALQQACVDGQVAFSIHEIMCSSNKYPPETLLGTLIMEIWQGFSLYHGIQKLSEIWPSDILKLERLEGHENVTGPGCKQTKSTSGFAIYSKCLV